jgi:uncharacterized phage protein (TIGR02218 family)
VKTPWYETSPGATAALLATGLFVDVDLYTFTLAGAIGGVSKLRYSAGTIAVAANGITWPANQVTFDQAKAKAVSHWKVGLDVDTWQVVVAPRNVDILTGAPWPDKIGTTPWLQALRTGALDGATVQVDRAFASAWPAASALALQPTGIVTIFFGRIAEGDAGRSQAVITINSHLEVIKNPMPRRLYQAGCIHTLFDTGCTLNAASFAVQGTVTTVSANVITATAAAPANSSGTFALGRLVMTSGASAGFSRRVKSWASGSPSTFTLISPFPLAVAPGDTFTAYPGCDKQFSTCGLYQNQVNFGGEIGIPAPEMAV